MRGASDGHDRAAGTAAPAHADVICTGLADRLNAKDWTASQASIASKLSQGAFTATFFLAALAEIGVEVVRLGKI